MTTVLPDQSNYWRLKLKKKFQMQDSQGMKIIHT